MNLSNKKKQKKTSWEYSISLLSWALYLILQPAFTHTGNENGKKTNKHKQSKFNNVRCFAEKNKV